MFTDRLARARVPRPRRDGHRPFQVQELDPPSDPSPDISATQALRKGVDDPSGGERLRQIGGSVGELVELLPTFVSVIFDRHNRGGGIVGADFGLRLRPSSQPPYKF